MEDLETVLHRLEKVTGYPFAAQHLTRLHGLDGLWQRLLYTNVVQLLRSQGVALPEVLEGICGWVRQGCAGEWRLRLPSSASGNDNRSARRGSKAARLPNR